MSTSFTQLAVLFSIYFIPWIVLGLGVAWVAHRQGRSALGYGLFSLLLTPFITYLALLALGPNHDVLKARKLASANFRACPHCLEPIPARAPVCSHCGRDVLQ